jgi:hypothetical protein
MAKMGESMVKWTKIVLWDTKTIIFLVEGLNIIENCKKNKWDFIHDDLYCCVKYSNVEYQVGVFNTYH